VQYFFDEASLLHMHRWMLRVASLANPRCTLFNLCLSPPQRYGISPDSDSHAVVIGRGDFVRTVRITGSTEAVHAYVVQAEDSFAVPPGAQCPYGGV